MQQFVIIINTKLYVQTMERKRMREKLLSCLVQSGILMHDIKHKGCTNNTLIHPLLTQPIIHSLTHSRTVLYVENPTIRSPFNNITLSNCRSIQVTNKTLIRLKVDFRVIWQTTEINISQDSVDYGFRIKFWIVHETTYSTNQGLSETGARTEVFIQNHTNLRGRIPQTL